jgi:chromatin remodeling complex protein RSC6
MAKAKKSAKKATKGVKKATKGAKKASASKSVKAVKAVKAKAAKKKTSGRKPNAAFMAPVTPSDALASVVGAKPIPRTEVTKRLWIYIKKNGLQDATNRRMIKADATLKQVFGGKAQVNMFEMTKLVGKHLK